ncbi:MAG: response regulator [Candidatus Nanoperiomorbaceae bacterium]
MTKIAIIEDDNLIAEMYRMKFDSDGFDTSVAENGLSGVEMVAKTQPDLVLLDLTLPDIGGDEVLEKIRSISTALATPVIILTNMDDQNAPKRLAKWDIADYIVKANFTPREVVAKIKDVLGRREALKKL